MTTLKKYTVFEPESQWYRVITAKTPEQAKQKAWTQVWEPILKQTGFLHFNGIEDLEVELSSEIASIYGVQLQE